MAVVVDVVVLILISPQAVSRNDATTLAVLPVFWLSCRSDSKLFYFPLVDTYAPRDSPTRFLSRSSGGCLK